MGRAEGHLTSAAAAASVSVMAGPPGKGCWLSGWAGRLCQVWLARIIFPLELVELR